MQRNRYIDLHSDTITMLHYPKENLIDNKRMVSIADLKEGGALVQCFSAFVPTGYFPKFARDKMTWNRFNRIVDKKDALLKLHSDILIPVHNVDDIELCRNSNKIGALFTIEDAGVIGDDIAKLQSAYTRGVRIASLTWNHENTLAFPNSVNPDVMKKGLKPFGVQTVERMNELGIVIDVSHLSDGGFWDVVKMSKKPFVATHSNSRAVTNHPRNMTDEMIKALAEKGGVMGLNFAPDFLSSRKDKQSRINDMVKHILHIRNIGGSGVLAVGTDFDGIHGELEIKTPADMPLLFDALLKAGLTQSELDNMKSGNIMRVFNEVWK
ncbi:MAG: dipeptidase [Eubacterium sp.]